MGTWRGCGQLVVRHNTNSEDRFSGLDLVTGGEHGLLNSSAIQKRAVGAFLIDDAAAARATLDREMHAGHVVVLRDRKLRAIHGTADKHCVTGDHGQLLAHRWAGFNFQQDAQIFLPAERNQFSRV